MLCHFSCNVKVTFCRGNLQPPRMSYTLNTAVHLLDEAAVEVTFKLTNFKEAILLNLNGSFLRFKAFSVGWGKFCLRVFPSGVIGKLGKVSAFLMNMSKNDFEVDLQIMGK